MQYTFTHKDIMNRNIINRIIKAIVISLDSNEITNISISMQLHASTNQNRQFELSQRLYHEYIQVRILPSVRQVNRQGNNQR